jgi:DNA polymerase I-like protein with 3'-5' exonuclease and polymerase domains
VEIDPTTSSGVVAVSGRYFSVRVWNPEIHKPLVGEAFGVDTETSLIEETGLPPLVLLQVANKDTVDLVTYDKAEEYFKLLEEQNPKATYYVLNVGFDIGVLNQPLLYYKLDQGEIIDVGMRHRVHQTAEKGYFEQPVSLAKLSKHYLKYELDKNSDVRLTFSRDMHLSKEHAEYAAIDAAVTLRLGEMIPKQPTEELQTQSAFALHKIEQTGMYVDREVFDTTQAKWESLVVEHTEKLRNMGFEPDAKRLKPLNIFNRVLEGLGMPPEEKVPKVTTLRVIWWGMMGALTAKNFDEFKIQNYQAISSLTTAGPLKGADKKQYEAFCDSAGMESFKKLTGSAPYSMCMEVMVQLKKEGAPLEYICAQLKELYEANAGWTVAVKQKGPTAYVQDHLKELEGIYGIEFPKTDSGALQLSKNNRWILDNAGIEDEFLITYMEYKHAEKMLSTYLTDKYIRRDGRVHPRFDPFKRTGRTGCSGPNLQNLPGEPGIREVYRAPDDHVLVSIDYSQLELCALAQQCYTTQGYSRMRELINAGVDLHSWFAARQKGTITEENDYYEHVVGSLETVKGICKHLKQTDGKARKNSKACNFGFPGGMQVETFLKTCRAQGITDLTTEEATRLRSEWMKAFPEMVKHMQPKALPRMQYSDRALYEASNILGIKRSGCSYNASVNFPFQSLAAAGAKLMLWWLVRRGFTVVNFIHDEVLLEIKTNELDIRTQEAKLIMVDAMKTVIPDVRIEVEEAAMIYWTKEAEPLFNDSGHLVPWDSEEGVAIRKLREARNKEQ